MDADLCEKRGKERCLLISGLILLSGFILLSSWSAGGVLDCFSIGYSKSPIHPLYISM